MIMLIFFEAMKKVEYYLGKIKNVARQKGMSKEKLCSIIGAKDKSDVINVIKKIIIKEEGKEMKISDINPELAKRYVFGKKKAIELCQLLKKQQEDYFKWAKSELKDSGEDLTTFNFAVSLKNAIVTSFMKFTKKAINDYLTVIRKVLGGKSGKDKEENNKFTGKLAEQEKKMDAWHNGTRKQNVSSCSDAKLKINYNICKSKGYDKEAAELKKEADSRGLALESLSLDNIKFTLQDYFDLK